MRTAGGSLYFDFDPERHAELTEVRELGRLPACHNTAVAGKTIGQRVDRLERVVRVIAEDQVSLQKLIAQLATETRRGFDRVAKQFEETDRRMRQTDERMRQTDDRMRQLDERLDERIRQTDQRLRQTDQHMRQTDERSRKTDERIDKLVVAIGELIRRQNGHRK